MKDSREDRDGCNRMNPYSGGDPWVVGELEERQVWQIGLASKVGKEVKDNPGGLQDNKRIGQAPCDT